MKDRHSMVKYRGQLDLDIPVLFHTNRSGQKVIADEEPQRRDSSKNNLLFQCPGGSGFFKGD